MITIFFYLYILPMVIVLLYSALLDDETKTIRDLLRSWYFWALPLFNVFILCIVITYNIVDAIEKNVKLKKYWNRFLNIKLPKIHDIKL